MNILTPLAACVFALTVAVHGAESPVRFKTAKPDRVEVQRGADGPVLVTCLTTNSHGRPYLHPLRSPDGKGVLTQFSPGHHKHQTGLYWGPTRINGRDYFHNYNRKFWARTVIAPNPTSGGPLSWRSASELLDKDGATILGESQKWTMRDHGSWYTLDLEWTAHAETDVTIGKYAYGGLFLRMPWKRGLEAACINSEGQTNQAGEGKPARWVDLAMAIEGLGEMAHIAIIDHPGNRGYPTLWRIDGQFGIGPALSRQGDVRIPKGESATYRYRVVVYQGEFDRAKVDEESKTFGKLHRKAP